MKTFFTIIVVAFIANSTLAQNPMPNSSFENWYTASNSYLNPTGCDTDWVYNSNYDKGDYASASILQTTSSHSGKYALQVSDAVDAQNSQYFYGGYITFTFPVSFKPNSFSGWWLVNEGSSFTTSGFIKVNINDSLTGGYLGSGTVSTPGYGEEWNTYEEFTQDINYDSTAKSYLCSVTMQLDDGEEDNIPYMIFDDIVISATSGLSEVVGGGNLDFNVYPNPASTKAVLEYNLANSGNVHITLTDILGRTVKTVRNEYDPSGNYVLNVDVSGLSQGIYLCNLSTPDGNQVRKVIVTK